MGTKAQKAPWTLRDLRRVLTPKPGETLYVFYHNADQLSRVVASQPWNTIRLPVALPAAIYGREAKGKESYAWAQESVALWRAEVDRQISAQGPSVAVRDVWEWNGKATPKGEGEQAGRPEGESREKGTDEVAPQGDSPSEDAEKHGGDGNSGEVDHKAETSSQEQREGQDGEPSGNEGSEANSSGEVDHVNQDRSRTEPDTGSEATPQGEAPGGSGSKRGTRERLPRADNGGDELEEGTQEPSGEPTSTSTEATDSDPSSAADIPACDALDSASADEEPTAVTTATRADESPQPEADAESRAGLVTPTPTDSNASDASEAPDSEGGKGEPGEVVEDDTGDHHGVVSGPSRAPRPTFGGQFGEFTRGTRRHPVDARDTAAVRRCLEKILKRMDMGTQGEQSPRLHAGKLVRELVSKRMALSRCRKEELEPALRLILCDVSGSCSASSREVVAAAQALAEGDPSIAVVLHSNGFPIDSIGLPLGSEFSYAHGDPETTCGKWDEALAGKRIAGIVHFGDGDAGWLLQHLAHRWPELELIWLDCFSSKAGIREASAWAKQDLKTRVPGVHPRAWWWGINNARTAAIALREILKETR